MKLIVFVVGRKPLRIAIIVALLLAGCGSGSNKKSDDNYGLGFHYDIQGTSGVRLRYSSLGYPSITFVEIVYLSVQQCVGYNTPGPLVVFIDSVDDRVSSEIGSTTAGIYLDTGTIMLEHHLAQAGPGGLNEGQLKAILAHEFVHWITHRNGLLTISQQYQHDSTLFVDCPHIASLLDTD